MRSEPLGATQFVHSHYCLFRTPSVVIFVCPSLKRPSTKSSAVFFEGKERYFLFFISESMVFITRVFFGQLTFLFWSLFYIFLNFCVKHFKYPLLVEQVCSLDQSLISIQNCVTVPLMQDVKLLTYRFEQVYEEHCSKWLKFNFCELEIHVYTIYSILNL